MNSAYKLVLFDMDGTLVNSEVIAHEVLCEHLGEFDYELSPTESIRRFAGRNIPECFAEIGHERGEPLPEGFETEFRRRSAIAFEARLRPIDGVVELLTCMNQIVAVASNGPRFKIEANLRISGLDTFFGDRVFSAYEVNSWKPEPGLFLAAARALNIDPADCLVVEDTPTGYAAATAAGMDVMIHDPDGHASHINEQKKFQQYEVLAERTYLTYRRPIVTDE